MARKKVFFSYYYEKDGNRVDEIRSMGLTKDIKPVSKEDWNEICRQGDDSIKKWIDDNMKDAEVLVVFIGEETFKRKWIIYEIEKAWNEGKGILGIYIHNLADPVTGKCKKGENPFIHFKMNRDGRTLRNLIKCYDPEPKDAYNCIFENIEDWIADAKSIRDFY